MEEHLYFFGRIKGLDPLLLREEITTMLRDMGLEDKRHALSGDLSGGMKRKLSVGMAFVGGSRTVFLDEPTAGVDPFSRRAIWELLIKYRHGELKQEGTGRPRIRRQRCVRPHLPPTKAQMQCCR